MATTVISKNSLVRFSYANVFHPKAAQEGQDKKYSVSLLIPKTDKALLKEIEAAIEKETEDFKSKNKGKLPPLFKRPLRDGDVDRPEDGNYAGMMFINANAAEGKKPYVVGAGNVALEDEDDFYSGCWGKFSVNFFNFDSNGSKGVACGLNGVKKVKDGEKLSGGTTAAADFGDDNEEELD